MSFTFGQYYIYYYYYIAHNSATTPDIILTSNKIYHNTHTAQGPLTTSDRFLILFTISTKLIQIQTLPRPKFKSADWTQFQHELKERFNDPNIRINPTLEEIDSYLENWYSEINTAIQNNIPTTHHKTPSQTNFSHQTQTIIIQLNAIKQEALNNGWTAQLYRLYKHVQNGLQHLLTQDSRSHWSEVISETATQYTDPSTFRRKIKNLMGNDHTKPSYLTTQAQGKVHIEIERRTDHRRHWTQVFSDAEEP